MLKLPAVRFVRCFDVQTLSMRNLWMLLTTQEQIDNAPMAVECTVTAQTVEQCLSEIEKMEFIPRDALESIRRASEELIEAAAPKYEWMS